MDGHGPAQAAIRNALRGGIHLAHRGPDPAQPRRRRPGRRGRKRRRVADSARRRGGAGSPRPAVPRQRGSPRTPHPGRGLIRHRPRPSARVSRDLRPCWRDLCPGGLHRCSSALMVGLPRAAQDRLPAGSPDTRPGCPGFRGTSRRRLSCWYSGTRTRCCAAMSAGSGTASRPDVVRCAGTAHTPPALDRIFPSSTADWTAQQARNLALTLDRRFEDIRFLTRDRGWNFTASSDTIFQASGARILRSDVRVPRMNVPRMNAICERLVGTLRRELLGWTLILGEAHLRTVLTEYHALQHGTAAPGNEPERPQRRMGRSSRHHDRRHSEPIRRKAVLGG